MASKKPVNGGSTFIESGSTTLEFFSEAKAELYREVVQHPVLQMNLRADAEGGDEGVVIGTIAAYCNVKMDGTYQREEIEHLYPILVERLREMRRIKLH
jgi:hypothetical protein